MKKNKIPPGLYCYSFLEWNKITGAMITKNCPYFGVRDGFAYCEYMKMGNDPYLDDQVKICGIDDEPEGGWN